ncbi:MAG: hypothetical protein KJ604_20610 [Gammaproteobacteria bacterium]|nr:hypothetical protein [Gammaproteobacteria bacterium]
MAGEVKIKDITVASGVPGLSIWSGMLSEEYLNALKGIRRFQVFREMGDDAVIGALLDSMVMPLLAAEMDSTPLTEAEPDKKASEFIVSCMDDMNNYQWRQTIMDLLSMLTYGWAISEMIFKKRLGPDANPPSQYKDGRIGLKIIDPRGQETLERWKMDDEYNVEQFLQRDPVTGVLRTMKYWKLIHVTFRSRKRSPEGSSPLRSLYRAWYTRKSLEVIEAIGAERDLAGLPVIKLPSGATTTDKDAAETIVRNIRLDEEAGVVLPAPPPGAEHGWELSLLSTAGTKTYDVREIVRDLNKIILMRFFAQFLMLGMEKAGTQALVEGSQDFFSLALKSVQQEILEGLNLQLVPLLMKLNRSSFSGITGMPKIGWASPGKKDVASAADMLAKLVPANVITPEPGLEDWIRSMGGLPDRPEGVGEGPRLPMPIAPPGGGFMSYDWHQLPSGDWLVSRPKGRTMFAQPDVGDVHIPTGIGKIVCECLECGHQIETEGHCADLACPKCGGPMRRLDRPGFAQVAGTTGRRARGVIEKATNDYQGRLVSVYDQWAKETQKLLITADRDDKPYDEVVALLDGQLTILSMRLKETGRAGLMEAFIMGLGGAPDPEALNVLAKKIEENEKFIDESLIPRVRQRLVDYIADQTKTYQLDDLAFGNMLLALRGEPAGYAGGFWNAIFLGSGLRRKREDNARQQAGGRPKRVRWILDPGAKHCQPSSGFYGCAELAGEYDSWDALPTVPAGQVTCRGNCRCGIEVETDDGGWERVA